MTNHPTIKTIAKEASVTANTVSLALRDSPLVAPDTKIRILEIARKRGYVPNILAESLRSGRSRTVALAFCDLGNPLFAMKTRKMEKAFRMRGYQVLILNTNEDPEQEVEAIRVAISRKVDGVVLCPSQKGREALDMLRQYNIPCVLVGRSFQDGLEDSVVWDNEQGGYLATQYLISEGCRNILCLLGSLHLSTSHERYHGYQRALKEAGLEEREELLCTPKIGEMKQCLAQLQASYDGIFAFSDLFAWETACYAPKDVRIVGFDDIQSFMALPFAISSIAADLDEETKSVAELLLGRMEEPSRATQRIVLPVRLAKR